MNKDYLMQSAAELVQPSAEAASEYEQKRDSLADEHNRQMGARPDLEKLIGPDNRTMMEDNSRNFCRFMGSMYRAYEPEILVETVLWVFRAYRAHGFKTAYWPAHLDTFVDIARNQLSAQTFASIYPFMNWMITNIPVFVAITDAQTEHLNKEPPGHHD